MEYNTRTFLMLLMVYEQQSNSHCRFPSALHLSLDVVEVKVSSQLHAAGTGLPLRRPCARPTEHLYNSISEEARSSLEYGLSSYWMIIFSSYSNDLMLTASHKQLSKIALRGRPLFGGLPIWILGTGHY